MSVLDINFWRILREINMQGVHFDAFYILVVISWKRLGLEHIFNLLTDIEHTPRFSAKSAYNEWAIYGLEREREIYHGRGDTNKSSADWKF